MCINVFTLTFSALLSDMDWTKESISLQRNLALGDAKHRRLVQNLYEDVRQGKTNDAEFKMSKQNKIGHCFKSKLCQYILQTLILNNFRKILVCSYRHIIISSSSYFKVNY
jgi:hypothetical protein